MELRYVETYGLRIWAKVIVLRDKNIATRCDSMLIIGMRLPRKRHETKLGHGMCVLCVIMWIDEWLYDMLYV